MNAEQLLLDWAGTALVVGAGFLAARKCTTSRRIAAWLPVIVGLILLGRSLHMLSTAIWS